MGFATFGPGRTVRWLRSKAGFVYISQFDSAGLRLGNEVIYVALGLREALGVALFFKL